MDLNALKFLIEESLDLQHKAISIRGSAVESVFRVVTVGIHAVAIVLKFPECREDLAQDPTKLVTLLPLNSVTLEELGDPRDLDRETIAVLNSIWDSISVNQKLPDANLALTERFKNVLASKFGG